MTLARMYSQDCIRDDSMTIGVIHSCSGDKSKSNTINIPPWLNCSFLSSSIDCGDVVEYKLDTSEGNDDGDQCIRRAMVVAICLELDCRTKSILLNNGDRLVNSLHMVRRVSIQNIYTGEAMWNPGRDWVALPSIHKHPPVDAADGPGKLL